jgi:hypothetical protein
MNTDDRVFPARDERLRQALDQAAPLRARSDEEWAALAGRVVAAAELPLARRRRVGWAAPLADRAGGFAAAAAVILLIMGGLVYQTGSSGASFAEVSAELMDLLGEEEVKSFFPGIDDSDHLLEAALAAR